MRLTRTIGVFFICSILAHCADEAFEVLVFDQWDRDYGSRYASLQHSALVLSPLLAMLALPSALLACAALWRRRWALHRSTAATTWAMCAGAIAPVVVGEMLNAVDQYGSNRSLFRVPVGLPLGAYVLGPFVAVSLGLWWLRRHVSSKEPSSLFTER